MFSSFVNVIQIFTDRGAMTASSDASWSPYAHTVYDAMQCGSIDGTDTEPHDAAIVRALSSDYRPPANLDNCALNTILVARLNRTTTEETLRGHFKRYGNIKSLRIVRNIVTGFSQGYAFIEYAINEDAVSAWKRGNETVIDGREVVVEYELQRSLIGWVPRRLGGGFGGKKESGQLRFGCRDRPFHKPIQAAAAAGGDGGGSGAGDFDVGGGRSSQFRISHSRYDSAYRSPMQRSRQRSRSRDRDDGSRSRHRYRSRSRDDSTRRRRSSYDRDRSRSKRY